MTLKCPACKILLKVAMSAEDACYCMHGYYVRINYFETMPPKTDGHCLTCGYIAEASTFDDTSVDYKVNGLTPLILA